MRAQTLLPLLWILVLGHYTSGYEIVFPQLVVNRERRNIYHQQEQGSDNLLYSIETIKQTLLLKLQRNREFLSSGFEIFTYSNKTGFHIYNRTGLPHACYYHGEVEGANESLVALSTCDGLRGVININDGHYGIEPVQNSSSGEHRLFQVPLPSEPMVCGVGDFYTETPYLPYSLYYGLRRKKRGVLPTTSYVELGAVVDNLRFKADNMNMTALEVETVQLINIVDSMFIRLNIRIILTSLTVFNQTNPFDVSSGTAGDVLGRFSDWKNQNNAVRSDISHLLIGRDSFSGVVGMAFVGTVCSPNLGTSISTFTPGKDIVSHASVVAHELGHNLGMSHDDSSCSDFAYIMHAVDTGSKNFSSCSANDFEALVLRGGGTCLKNLPDPNQVISIPSCGNNILEKGEECDCGSPKDCQNPCCNAATCTLTSGSQCAQGLCCENCKFKVAGIPCRPSANLCDLPEYCYGNNALCPADVYIMNGFPCNNSQYYCYSGICQNHDMQCQQLFGKGSQKRKDAWICNIESPPLFSAEITGPRSPKKDTRKADDKCFQQANLKGDQYGNCGISGGSYKKCPEVDSLCGKLQCTGTSQPIFNGHVQIFYAGSNQNLLCLSVDFDLGTDVPDPGLVHQGTACGNGKACVNYGCSNASALGYNCDVKTKCSDHGVCNNNGNCHCSDGWAPPYCDRAGYGGSIDSGPAHIDTSLRDGLLIFFLLVLPILILIIVAVIKRDALERRFCRRRRRQRRENERRQAENNTNRNIPQTTARDKPRTTFSDVFTISHNLPKRQPIPNGKPTPPSRPQLPSLQPQNPPLRPPPPRLPVYENVQ